MFHVSNETYVKGGIIFFLVLLAMVLFLISTGLSIDNPRFERTDWKEEPIQFPSILRFISHNPEVYGQICFGLIIETKRGEPTKVLNLSAIEPRLGSEFLQFIAMDGFTLADEWFKNRSMQVANDFMEIVDQSELAERILSPVDFRMDELINKERLIIGVGFNYSEHIEESDSDVDRFAFAKLTEPVGAYAPITMASGIDTGGEPAWLTDYEVELAFVVLEDIAVTELTNDPEAFNRRIAFFNANDVTDRKPIIIEGHEGFTIAKSKPGYLPLGPWMIHGRNLMPKTGRYGKRDLAIGLRVFESIPSNGGSWRQEAKSSEMIRSPLAILKMLPDIYKTSYRSNKEGKLYSVLLERDDKLIIPRGSIVLTGTPEGTAIEAPGLFDKLRLLIRAGFSLKKVRLLFTEHSISYKKEMGYLSPGDRVDANIQYLGTQRWLFISSDLSQQNVLTHVLH